MVETNESMTNDRSSMGECFLLGDHPTWHKKLESCVDWKHTCFKGDATACHDGEVYGPCESEYCPGQCEYEGTCRCPCHSQR
jgi:hypothetical protein